MSDHLEEFTKLGNDTLAWWFGTAMFLGALSFVRTGFKDGLTFFALTLFVYGLARFSRLSNVGAIVVTALVWVVTYFFVRRVVHV